ncbi:diaminopropionate ammonia-lyase [Propionispora vibrioides]|uniref:Diaminopropionate ammonia-lyase n=1 Tax=Propionispora vibrioides TaxID=112903 RepID=A0A1H8TW62_9FIRM|nr:diaminopropionate ammonia-lyase [Propionispora vibrioides]SEO95066.1 diaminopropionate ammonia-lyase [Propionispora vibrioides]
MNQVAWLKSTLKRQQGTDVAFLGPAALAEVAQFHSSFSQYQVTPLRSLQGLADKLGVGGIYVKDESYRFGLNAFKVMGASYAIGKYLAGRLGKDLGALPFAVLSSAAVRETLGEITFVTATDGNHGRGVAWTARVLGQKAVVYMPKGSSLTRLQHIQSEGAEASITELNYDEAVDMAAEQAGHNGWVVVQDTAWEGYETIPVWIMQGYAHIAAEIIDQFRQMGPERPTHVFLQAGVGSFAAAIAGHFIAAFGTERPVMVLVEPNQADCFYRSVLAADGRERSVSGDMATIMAGLACGKPNPLSWSIIRDYGDMFFSCPDWVTAKGMRVLGNSVGQDERVIAGESGAVGAGLLAALLERKELWEARMALGLDQHSRVLLISTEGDTDPASYRKIVWDGAYPSWQEGENPC